MATRLFFRTASHARTMTSSLGRVYMSRPAMMNKATLPSLSSTFPKRTFTVAFPRFSNGEGKNKKIHET